MCAAFSFWLIIFCSIMFRMNSSARYIIVIAAVFIIGMFIFGYFSHRPSNSNIVTTINPETLSGIQTGSAPWQPEIDHLKERLGAIGLPALAEEGTVLHTHQHLDIFIDGKSTPVPADIGVNELQNFISPVHTHDYTAVIHVESPTIQKFYLGQFFDVWGVRFNENCIGGYCTNSEKKLKVFVDGKQVTGDPRLVELLPHQEIAIVYGSDAEIPKSIPSSYSFSEGL